MRRLFKNRKKFRTAASTITALSPSVYPIGYGQSSVEWTGSTGSGRYPNNKLAISHDGSVLVAGGGTVINDAAALVDIWALKDITGGVSKTGTPAVNISPKTPSLDFQNATTTSPIRTGGSVAVSGDGKTVLYANCSTHSSTAVYGLLWDPTITNNGVANYGGWVSMTGLPAPGYSAAVGSSLSLSYNGLVVAIGAYRDNKTFIYTRSSGSTSWSLSQTLDSPNAVFSGHFGISCKLSYDGTRLVVGAPGELTNNGQVYVYENSGGTWSLAHTINPGITSGSASAGYMVTGNKDLTLLAVGIPTYDAPGLGNQGIVYIYKYNGSSYSLIQQINSLDNTNLCLWGCSVSMTANGQYLTIGQQNEAHASYGNPIYKWNSNTNTYSLLQNLPLDFIAGANIQLSGNGKVAVVARSNSDNAPLKVYRR